MPQSAASPSRSRLDGIDIARALALIGMLTVHFGPKDDESLLGRLYALPHGRASILFVVVAGVGLSLLSRRAEAPSLAQLRLLAFALILLPLGLFLEGLDHKVAVILHHYAAYFVLGAVALRLSTGNLLGAALGASVFGPLIYFYARSTWPEALTRRSVSLDNSPLDIAQALLWSGPYPLLIWGAPLLWGMWLGRQNLHRRGVLLAMLVAGALLAGFAILTSDLATNLFGQPPSDAIADQRYLLTTAAHSQMPLWLLQAMAMATAVLALCLMLADVLGRVLAPLAAMGRMVLSLYVLHLAMLTLWPGLLAHDDIGQAAMAVLGFAIFGMVAATFWPFRRGPVETALHWFARQGTGRFGPILLPREEKLERSA